MAPPTSGQDNGGDRGRGDPPPAESPVWLPTLSQPKVPGSRSPGVFTLPKTRHLPMANTTRGAHNSDAGLYSMSTLPQLDALDFTARTNGQRRKVGSVENV